MLTPAKLAANRRNAELSTGPKTPEGLARSSQNSTKHGLFAKAPVLPGEKPEDYATLRQQYFEELQPQGAFETELVERIINAAWRMRRFGRIEAEILSMKLNRMEPGEENRLGLAFMQSESTDHEMGKLYRYEMALERSFYRAMKELAALQAARREATISEKKDVGTNPPMTYPQYSQGEAAGFKPDLTAVFPQPGGTPMVPGPESEMGNWLRQKVDS